MPFNKKTVNSHISVLYVEDQIDIQEELVDILGLFVDEVIVASNGEEGLQKYQEHFPDIIITDIQMPLMNGLDMIKKIREDNNEIPVIVTSAFNENRYLLDAISLGVEYYLLKPVMIDSLQDRLEHVKKRILQKRELEMYHLYLEDRVKEEIALRENKESMLIQQNKAAEVGQMVSIIAHQWKQPLHYLNLLIEDLGLEFDHQPLSKAYIEDFVAQGTKRIAFLSDTMDNFLHFFKKDTTVKTFSVSNVTREILSFLSAPYKAWGIALDIQVENDFYLRGISNELQQVVLNLLNNAKEAFGRHQKEDAKISIIISAHGTEGTLIIKDNAGGISETNINAIFKLEYTTKKDGSGIGLYLAEKIVSQRFNGTISVSNDTYGACFTLKFSIAQENIV